MNEPHFLLNGLPAGLVVLLGTLAATALGWAEWRRRDQRRRAARMGATLAAVGSLALLTLRPTVQPSEGRTPSSGADPELALWTSGPRPTDETAILRNVPADLRFRLPGADAPEGTPTVPDAASLRRHVHRAGTLHLLGDGLDPDDLATLAPWRIAFHPGPDNTVPRIVSAQAPRVLAPGEPWWMAGQVRGGAEGVPLTVAWEGPSGVPPITAPVGVDGTFRVRGPGFPTPGRFGWKLRLVGAGERVLEEESGGVSVVASDRPRTLVLEAAPHPDTAALRRWLAEGGSVVTTRTEIGRGRYRFAAVGGGPGEFTAVDAVLLGGFDLVLVDHRSLETLAAPEREALAHAVRGGALGVLVWGEPPAPGVPAGSSLLPWRLEPNGETAGPEAGSDRPARLRWTGRAGEENSPDEPVPVLPYLLASHDGAGDGTVVLVRDGQGRVVAGRASLGRGRVGITLTTDTARWRRTGHPEAFASFWSTVLGDLAPPGRAGSAGRWTLAGEAATGPAGARADEAVELRWQGGEPGGTVPPPGNAVAEDSPAGDASLPLPLAQVVAEPTRWTARFWPRHAGWHRVQMSPDRPVLDFYVAPATAWPGVRAAGRRRATARFLALAESPARASVSSPPEPSGAPVDSAAAATGLFLAFVAAVGFLWMEGRRESQTSPQT